MSLPRAGWETQSGVVVQAAAGKSWCGPDKLSVPGGERPPLPEFRVLPQLSPALPPCRLPRGAELWCWRGAASLAHLRRRIELRGKGFPDAVATACVGEGRQSLIGRTAGCVALLRVVLVLGKRRGHRGLGL